MSHDVRRGTSRFVTEGSGVRTHHSFSFGRHYDPANLGFGPVICHDDHLLDPGRGFRAHRHTDVEIVTWVVRGRLVHDGSSVLVPGQVAVQSSGSGITHSEVAGEEGCRFVQAWLRPDQSGGTPARTVAEASVIPGELIPLVGHGAPVPLGVAGASLAVVRLEAGGRVAVPAAPLVHGYLVSGAVTWGGLGLTEGDAVRGTGEPDTEVVADADAEVLVWRVDPA